MLVSEDTVCLVLVFSFTLLASFAIKVNIVVILYLMEDYIG